MLLTEDVKAQIEAKRLAAIAKKKAKAAASPPLPPPPAAPPWALEACPGSTADTPKVASPGEPEASLGSAIAGPGEPVASLGPSVAGAGAPEQSASTTVKAEPEPEDGPQASFGSAPAQPQASLGSAVAGLGEPAARLDSSVAGAVAAPKEQGTPDFYALLGLKHSASTSDIINAFRLLGEPASHSRVKDAYEVLVNPVCRAGYDMMLREFGHDAGDAALPECVRWIADKSMYVAAVIDGPEQEFKLADYAINGVLHIKYRTMDLVASLACPLIFFIAHIQTYHTRLPPSTIPLCL